MSRCATIFMILGLTAGCTSQQSPNQADAPSNAVEPTAHDAASGTASALNSKLQLVDAEEFSEAMAARVGKVVLVDLWTSW